jgi:hypothetical protein
MWWQRGKKAREGTASRQHFDRFWPGRGKGSQVVVRWGKFEKTPGTPGWTQAGGQRPQPPCLWWDARRKEGTGCQQMNGVIKEQDDTWDASAAAGWRAAPWAAMSVVQGREGEGTGCSVVGRHTIQERTGRDWVWRL